jgi:predicted nucleic acid-binding protein
LQTESLFDKYQIFIDSTAFIALADANEQPNHSQALDFRDNFMDGSMFTLVTSDLVFAETLKHLQRLVWNDSLPMVKVEEFVDYVLNSKEVKVMSVDEIIMRQGYNISKSNHDKELDYIDGTSLALIERNGILHAFSFDTHFSYSYKKGYTQVLVQRFPN